MIMKILIKLFNIYSRAQINGSEDQISNQPEDPINEPAEDQIDQPENEGKDNDMQQQQQSPKRKKMKRVKFLNFVCIPKIVSDFLYNVEIKC
jgi:hypothetical protein